MAECRHLPIKSPDCYLNKRYLRYLTKSICRKDIEGKEANYDSTAKESLRKSRKSYDSCHLLCNHLYRTNFKLSLPLVKLSTKILITVRSRTLIFAVNDIPDCKRISRALLLRSLKLIVWRFILILAGKRK